MNRRLLVVFTIVLFLLSSNAVFAMSYESQPLGDQQEVLFSIENDQLYAPKQINDLAYDSENGYLYIILKSERYDIFQDVPMFTDGLEPIADQGNQLVYDLATKSPAVKSVYQILPHMVRSDIEFDADLAWSLEYDLFHPSYTFHSDMKNLMFTPIMAPVDNFAVQGNRVVCLIREFMLPMEPSVFLLGTTEAFSQMVPLYLDNENMGEEYPSAYDLSSNGKELVYVSSPWYRTRDLGNMPNFVVRYDLDNRMEINRFPISDLLETKYQAKEVLDLYTTEDSIVVLYRDEMNSYIDRYDYDGKKMDGVVADYGVSKITEGPNGSTLYIRTRYAEKELDMKYFFGTEPLEVVQITWEEEKTASTGCMRHVVQEQTRKGLTVARFTDNEFGLIRQEEAETGIVDYKAPLRSQEKTVRLQIPYADAAAKEASGARNLLVEYKDQSIAIPLESLECADLLAAMPCQDDATIEIILQADDDGNVTYIIQLYVVEQVNAMTKVVHRKTIQ